MATEYFRVRAHRPKTGASPPTFLDGTHLEPAEAADQAEAWLTYNGKVGQSYCDLLFNGDSEPHSSIFLAFGDREKGEELVFGVWNRDGVPWPIDYHGDDMGHGGISKMHPSIFLVDPDSEIPQKGEEAEVMKLDAIDDDDSDDFKEDDDGSEELWQEDDEDDSESYDDDEDGDEISDDDEIRDDDPRGDEEGEGDDEGEEEEPEESDDGDDGDEEADSEDDESDEDESENESEDEAPPVRLPIFAKMRGPKGWRKRADAEELNERNVFGLKIGVTDPDGKTPGQQEKNVRCEIQFVEQDVTRESGVLRIKMPDGVSLDDFTQLKSGWIIAQVPYTDQEA